MTREELESLDRSTLVDLVLKLVARLEALEAENAALKARIAELEKPPKTPSNSSLPPSTGQKANRPERVRKGRKGRFGVARQLAENPDRTVDLKATACPHCAAELATDGQKPVAVYDRIELPPIRPLVTRVHLHGGTCPCCRKRFTAQVPEGLEPGSPFGRTIEELVVYLHYTQAISYERLAALMREVFGVSISEGAIANMAARARERFSGAAERIAEAVRASPVVGCDETGARVLGRNWWEWVFVGQTAVLHVIGESRGKKVVAGVMGKARPDVWVSDLYGAQQGHGKDWQVCLAHQRRDIQYAIDEGDNVFAPALLRLILRACAIGRRRDRLKDTTLVQYGRELDRRLDRIMKLEPKGQAGNKLKQRMRRIRAHLFTFVTHRAVPPTNNAAERCLRPSVIFRKVTNGFRSGWGAELYAAIRSVLSTARLAGISALAAIRSVLAGTPLIATA